MASDPRPASDTAQDAEASTEDALSTLRLDEARILQAVHFQAPSLRQEDCVVVADLIQQRLISPAVLDRHQPLGAKYRLTLAGHAALWSWREEHQAATDNAPASGLPLTPSFWFQTRQYWFWAASGLIVMVLIIKTSSELMTNLSRGMLHTMPSALQAPGSGSILMIATLLLLLQAVLESSVAEKRLASAAALARLPLSQIRSVITLIGLTAIMFSLIFSFPQELWGLVTIFALLLLAPRSQNLEVSTVKVVLGLVLLAGGVATRPWSWDSALLFEWLGRPIFHASVLVLSVWLVLLRFRGNEWHLRWLRRAAPVIAPVLSPPSPSALQAPLPAALADLLTQIDAIELLKEDISSQQGYALRQMPERAHKAVQIFQQIPQNTQAHAEAQQEAEAQLRLILARLTQAREQQAQAELDRLKELRALINA